MRHVNSLIHLDSKIAMEFYLINVYMLYLFGSDRNFALKQLVKFYF